MKNYTKQILLKLRLAQKHLGQAMGILQKDPLSLPVIEQSQKAQDLLEEVDNLLARGHLENCISDLIRKGQMSDAKTEIKRLSKYGLSRL